MKIVSARVSHNACGGIGSGPPKYIAVVRISSDGAEGEASAQYDDPQQALHCAFDAACAHMLSQLRDSLQVDFAVRF